MKQTEKEFKKELKHFSEIYPVKAAQLRISSLVKKGSFWIVVTKEALNPLMAFTKDTDGTIQRVLVSDPEKSRRIRLMLKDGLPDSEILDIEQITQDQLTTYKGI